MPQPNKEQFSSFGFVQFFASVHIFTYHIWQQTKYLQNRSFRDWGPGWVACFFVLSGFKLTYSQLRKKDPSTLEPFVSYMWRRLLRLYPLYYCSLLITGLTRTQNFLWITLPFNLTLTFTWVGAVAGGWHSGWHGTHWYMGDLIVHYVLWRWTFPRLLRFTRKQCFCVLLVCIQLTSIRLVFIQMGLAEWETTYYVPYTFNQFVCGMCLAKLYVSRKSVPEGAPVDPLAITLRSQRVPLSGLLVFLLLFLIVTFVHPNWVLYFAHNCIWSGLLLPLFVLLVWCLTLEEGPLDWLCQRRPFVWMGELSYGIYIFHWNIILFTCHYGKALLPMHWSTDLRFWFILLPVTVLLSAFMMVFVDRPIQRWGAQLLRSWTAPATHSKVS